MYRFITNLKTIKCNSIYRRFYTPNATSTFLSNAVGELSNDQIIYSFDTLSRSKVRDSNLWDHLCDKIRFNLDTLDSKDLLKIIHSLAKVSHKKLSLLSVINRIILRKHKLIDPRDLTQYLIDLNKLDLLNINTFAPLVSAKIPDDISLFTNFDLCFILHLCSKLQYKDQLILDSICSRFLLNDYNYQELCSDKSLLAMVFRSLSFLQYKNELYKKLLYQGLPSSLYHFGSQELCNSLLSIVVSNLEANFDEQVKDIINSLIDRISERLSSLVEIEVNQLGICLYFLKYNMASFPGRFESLFNSIVELNIIYTPNTSKMQLGRLLDELKLKHKSELKIGPYTLDYAIPKINVAIEVNGYTHFFHNSKELNALTQLKYKILKDMGWNVVGINYYNWKNRNKQSRLDYIVKKITPFLEEKKIGEKYRKRRLVRSENSKNLICNIIVLIIKNIL
ncbi:uncharacterized protein TA17070 [Theileria annulata]|uniref:RAP domain-containing protein n=1 Tax=Theileria annulata TaxID=5874 RepID=Q4UIQ2_THEAN|nr:uncharacterized protein TA17070 [Theileria annulata]CAI73037.1 hypothetical protein, conserved [Theileria annulata]|eukprot:XP_953715.1 hypothetical protein, conserved [Theileria annulata]